MNQQILKEIKQLKKELLPFEKVVLFGSQARGDERENSDWDLLILLNKESITPEDDDKYAFPFVLMGWKHGAYISVKIYPKNEWDKQKPSLFRNNIEKEGIEII